jgi:hypothetical protein
MLRWLRKRPRSVRPCDYKMKRGDRGEYRQAAGAIATSLSASGVWLSVVPATRGMDWENKTRLSRAGQLGIAPTLCTGTAGVCQVC